LLVPPPPFPPAGAWAFDDEAALLEALASNGFVEVKLLVPAEALIGCWDAILTPKGGEQRAESRERRNNGPEDEAKERRRQNKNKGNTISIDG